MRISTMSEQATISEATDFAAGWDEFKPEEKRQLVELITDKIIVGKEDVAINLLYLPSAVETGGKATLPHGFMAGTNWNRAGEPTCALAGGDGVDGLHRKTIYHPLDAR
jgi:hypothetical protein